MANLRSILFFLILGIGSLQAQQIIEKTIERSSLDTIAVDGNHISKIHIMTNPHSSKIQLKATVQGRNQDDLSFQIEDLDNRLMIKLVKDSGEGSEKLSDHQLIVSELTISLPIELKLDLKSNIASVLIWGRYQGLRVKLDSGNLEFEGWAGKAEVKTTSADVLVKTDNSTIDAFSSNGTISIPTEFKSGFALWNIKSVHGDISVEIIK